MMKCFRIIAPLVALIVMLGANYAALGNGQAIAWQASASTLAPAAQPPTPAPTEVPAAEPNTGTMEQPEGSQTEVPEVDAKDGTADTETSGGTKQPGTEAADAAALASKATVTADQAKATALAANPGATVAKAELGDENGMMIYSVELSTGVDVKIDAKSGAILSTDQAGGNTNDGASDMEAPDAPEK